MSGNLVTDLVLRIRGDNSDAKQKLDDTGVSLGDLAKGAIATALAFVGVTSALGFVKDQLTESVQAATRLQDTNAQLAVALQSTGGAAGVTADDMHVLADRLSTVTKFSAETTLQAEVLMLRFQHIGEKVFPIAIQTAQDLSTRLGIDLNTAVKLVGKSLDDPIKGMTSLSRVGVTFDDVTKKNIATLVKHGDLLQAQGVLLDALGQKFGGASIAAGQTFAGSMAILNNQLEAAKEQIGMAIIPILSQLVAQIAPVVLQFAQKLPDALKWTQAHLTELWNRLAPVRDALGYVWEKAVALGKAFASDLAPKAADLGNTIKTKLSNVLDGAKTLFRGLGDALDWAKNHMDTTRPIILGIAVAISAVLTPSLIGAAAAATALDWPLLLIAVGLGALAAGVIYAYTHWGWFKTAVDKARDALGFLKDHIGDLMAVLGHLKDKIGDLLGKLGELHDNLAQRLQPALKNVSEKLSELHMWFNDKLLPVLKQVWAFFQANILPVLQQVAAVVRDQVLARLRDLWAGISTILLPILGTLAGFLVKGVGNGFQTLGWLIDGVSQAIGTLIGWVSSALNWLGQLRDAISKIKLPGGGNFHIPGFAAGTEDAPGGFALVHKDELVVLPQHSRVIPAAQTRALMNSSASSGGNGGMSGGGSGGGHGFSGTQIIVVELDGSVIARAAAKGMPREVRIATGQRI